MYAVCTCAESSRARLPAPPAALTPVHFGPNHSLTLPPNYIHSPTPGLYIHPPPQVEFNKAALSHADAFPAEQKKAALNRLLKDNVALIAVLEALEPPFAEVRSSLRRIFR